MEARRKIYLAQYNIDWHNCDPENEVFAYYKQEDAQNKILQMIKEFKAYCAKNDKDIAFERNGASGTFIETCAGDYFSAWINTPILH